MFRKLITKKLKRDIAAEREREYEQLVRHIEAKNALMDSIHDMKLACKDVVSVLQKSNDNVLDFKRKGTI